MSANREDALTGLREPRLPFNHPVPAGPDSTEDLAEEITSELGAAPKAVRPAPVRHADVPDPADLAAGNDVLRERYVLEAQLGAGGTAVIFRAEDLRRDADAVEGRHVAIKLLRPELRDRPHAIARLQREFRQSQAVAHPGIVRVFDLDCDRGTWFIVMELLTGETVGPALRRAAPSGLPADEAFRIACAAGEALAHAHACGIAHGDVKPDNIFLAESGETRLLDFGVAPESAPGAGESVPAAATRIYASPEVLDGARPAPRDDVFSLACVTYEMLAGAHPYGRRGTGQAAGAGSPPERIESLDDPRWSALAAALSPGRDARPDMAEFVRALRGREPGIARPVVPVMTAMPHPEAASPAARRGRWAILAVLIACLALALGIYIGSTREPGVAGALPPTVAATPQAAVDAQPEPASPAAVGPPREGAPAQPAALVSGPASGPPGIIFFDSARMIVSKHAVVAAIPMRHLSKVRRAVTFNWQIIEGTARVDRDFGGPMNGTESFVEGNSFRILYIPILQDAEATRDRRFTVEMTGVSAGTDLGPTPRIEVTILGAS